MTTKQSYSYYSEKYMLEHTNTKSLSKLENLVSKSNGVEKYPVSGYLFYSGFKNKESNKYKYPHLYELYMNYKNEAFTKKEGKNKFRDVQSFLEFKSNEKNENKKMKDDYREKLLKELSRTGLSLNFVAKENNVKYSNLFNYLYKNMNTKMSTSNATDLYLYLKEKD